MVTQCDTRGRKNATINLYAGIFDSKLFRGGGQRHVENWSRPENGVRENAFSDIGLSQIEKLSGYKSLHEDAPSDGALFRSTSDICTPSDGIAAAENFQYDANGRRSEKSSLRYDVGKSPREELEPISDFNVADTEEEGSQFDVISVQYDGKKNLHVNANSGLNKNISQLSVASGKKNLQNKAGRDTVAYMNMQCNVRHRAHDHPNRFLDASCDNMEIKDLQGRGPYLPRQNMQGVSEKALQRVTDVNDSSGLVAGVSDDCSVASTPGKLGRNGIVMKNFENGHSRTDGLPRPRETTSTSIQVAETLSLRRASASVNEICSWEGILDSTALASGHTSTLCEKSGESHTFSSNQSDVDVSTMSAGMGTRLGLRHGCMSGNPNRGKLNGRDQLDDPSLVQNKNSKVIKASFATDEVVESLYSGETNGRCAKERINFHALNLSKTQNSGEMSLDSCNKAYKSGEPDQNGRGDANGLAWKKSPSRGHPLVASLRIGEPVSFDSSSSYGGSSSSGSPMASEALKDGRVCSSGNILVSKGSPYSASSRSMGSVTGYGNTGNALLSPTSSNGSPGPHPQWGARKLDEVVLNRKSSDTVHNGYDNMRSSGAYRMSADGTSNTYSNMGNLSRGNHLVNGKASLGNAQGNLLNNGNLLVGGSNGNVLSYGGGTKMNAKQEEAKQGNPPVDYRLMKRALASSDPEEIKNAGNEYYKAGHFSESLTLYDRAIALYPRNVMYRSNRAAALSSLGRLGEAVKECEEAIMLDSSYARAHQRVASLYIRLGLMESAKQHFHAAGRHTDLIEVQRLQTIEKHLFRCIEARNSGDWHSVIRESDAAVVAGADSAPQIFGFKSEALLRLHKLEHADSVCTIAQKIEGSLISHGIGSLDPFLYITRAQVDMALGRFEEAFGAAEAASRIDPSNAYVTALLRKARAVAQARATGNELFKGGRLFEALALYAEGLESDPTNAVLLCNRAACRLKLGQWEKAVEDCDAALRVQPNYTKALLRRASSLTKLERWEDALQDYEILRRELPGDTEVARGFFDVQVAMKKSRGEEVYGMKFGGDVEEVTTDEQFRDAVSSPGLSVVQFITRWSDRCRELLPFINHLCRHHPCVNFVKVDVEDLPYLAKIESITFIPTFKIYKNGQKLKEILGPSQQSLEYAVQHYSL